VPVLLASALALIPPVYLVIRTSEAGPAFLELLADSRTWLLLANSAGLAFAVTFSAIAVALPVAWLTTRTDLAGRDLWATLAVLPLVIPTFVGGFVFVAAFGHGGLLQALLGETLGYTPPDIYGFTGSWIALTLFTYPYVLLPVRAALRRLDLTLEEAARSLGQSAWSVFWRVTVPQLRPAVTAGGLLVALYTLSEFGVVSLLRFDTFTRAIYIQYQGSFDRTIAAGFALVLVALSVSVLLLEGLFRGGARYHRSTPGAARTPRPVRLGRWAWAAQGYVGGVLAIALVLPVAVLVYWLLRGLDQGLVFRHGAQAITSSLLASGLAAGATGLAAVPVALLLVRYPSRLAALVERAVYSGFALPGITIALALVFVAARYATPVYQTLGLLIVAYLVRFLPEAVGSTRASLLQVNPRLEEAARCLGRSPLQAFATITLPLMLPGILVGMALAFLSTMKELPVTLLLAPTGFRTLATNIWSGASEGLFAEAALGSLVLIGLSALALPLANPERWTRGHDA
jgi:iron(III) transport system permease protein